MKERKLSGKNPEDPSEIHRKYVRSVHKQPPATGTSRELERGVTDDNFPLPLTAVGFLLIGFFLYTLRQALSPLLMGLIILVFFWLARKTHFKSLIVLNYFVIFILVVWLFSEISHLIFPIVIAFIFAYLFNPLVNFMSRKMTRNMAIFLIILFIAAFLVTFSAILFPILRRQVTEILSQENIDIYYGAIQRLFERLVKLIPRISIGGVQLIPDVEKIPGKIQEFFQVGPADIEQVLIKVLSRSRRLIASIINLVLIPFATYYILKDYGMLRVIVRRMIPQRHRREFYHLYEEIDAVVGGWLRGQLLVCLFIMILTTLGLLIMGIQYYLIFGIMAGLFTILPYIGVMMSFLPPALVALLNTTPGWMGVVKVFIVFFIVQSLEGNVVTPYIVGKKVGLHPIWVIISLLVFAHFWGFVGVIVSIPVAAVISVVVKRLIRQYYHSQYYMKSESPSR